MEYTKNKPQQQQQIQSLINNNNNQTEINLMAITLTKEHINHINLNLNNNNNIDNKINTVIPLIKANQYKLAFTKFYFYFNKMEIHITELESLLFWTSIAEIFFFFLGISIYFSHPKTLDFLWVFIVHLIRAVIGLAFLRIFPHTYEVIESSQLSSATEFSIEDIEALFIKIYKRLFSRKKSNIKVIFVVYCLLTTICSSVNDFILISIFRSLCNGKYRLKNIMAISFVIVYFICNGVYYSWFSALRNNLPVLSTYMIRMFFKEIMTVFGLFKRRKKNDEELMGNQSMAIKINRTNDAI